MPRAVVEVTIDRIEKLRHRAHADRGGSRDVVIKRSELLVLCDLALRSLHASSDVSTYHRAYVEPVPDSFRRGGSCRTAACSCGWKGPQRATLVVAADDALQHESTNANHP